MRVRVGDEGGGFLLGGGTISGVLLFSVLDNINLQDSVTDTWFGKHDLQQGGIQSKEQVIHVLVLLLLLLIHFLLTLVYIR